MSFYLVGVFFDLVDRSSKSHVEDNRGHSDDQEAFHDTEKEGGNVPREEEEYEFVDIREVEASYMDGVPSAVDTHVQSVPHCFPLSPLYLLRMSLQLLRQTRRPFLDAF